MTEKAMKYLAAGLKEAGKTGFAQPQQAAVLEAILLDNKIAPSAAKSICIEFGPFFNASSMLGTLKKMGIVPAELTAKQKAEAAALAKALKEE